MNLIMFNTYRKGGKYFARMLTPGSLNPCDYFGSHPRQDMLEARIQLTYTDALIVSDQEFDLELDHIKLFGARSDGDLVLYENADDNIVIDAVLS